MLWYVISNSNVSNTRVVHVASQGHVGITPLISRTNEMISTGMISSIFERVSLLNFEPNILLPVKERYFRKFKRAISFQTQYSFVE